MSLILVPNISLRQVSLALLLPLLRPLLGLKRVKHQLLEAVPHDQGRHGPVKNRLRQNFVGEVDGKRVGLRRAGQFDPKGDAHRYSDDHGGAEGAVGGDAALDAVLYHCAECSQPGDHCETLVPKLDNIVEMWFPTEINLEKIKFIRWTNL
jgi:hypothetical protein